VTSVEEPQFHVTIDYLPHDDFKQDGQMLITGIPAVDCTMCSECVTHALIGTTEVSAHTKMHLKYACDEKRWYEKICFKLNALTSMAIS
jgi:hypothetical protein